MVSGEENFHDVVDIYEAKYWQETNMETIIFVLIILALAGGAIWYYNRTNPGADINQDGQVDAADVKLAIDNTIKGAMKDARDARDLALHLNSESAAKTLNAVEKVKKPRAKPTVKSAAKPAAKSTGKKPAGKAPAKPRAKKSSQ